MRLKAVAKSKDDVKDWTRCCKFCKYFCDGKCYNTCFQGGVEAPDLESPLYNVSEQGHAIECIREVLNDGQIIRKFMMSVEHILDKWNISQKRKKEFEEFFIERWSETSSVLEEELDENILECYLKHVEDHVCTNEGFIISNPQEYVCCYWE